MNHVYFKDNIIEEEKARVPLSTHTLQYGTGVFDSVRGYWHKEEERIYLLKPKEHFDRLLDSAKILGWKLSYSSEFLVVKLTELVKINQPKEDIYARPFIFQATSKLTPIISDEYEPTLAMYMIGLGDYLSTGRGLKGIVTSWRRIEDSMIPPRAKVCGLYVNSSLARAEASRYGADEAIFLNQDGSVSEGSGENIFIVRDGVLITPPVSANILEGVTRDCVIEIAKEFVGVSVVERNIDRSELYIADEVFLTGTACQVAYFCEIDNRIIGAGEIGPITKKIQDTYFAAAHKQLPQYEQWLTGV